MCELTKEGTLYYYIIIIRYFNKNVVNCFHDLWRHNGKLNFQFRTVDPGCQLDPDPALRKNIGSELKKPDSYC